MSSHSDSQSSSQVLSASYPSLRNSKKASSELSKVYKHASQLYLTRRLFETYELLQPVISPPPRNSTYTGQDEEPPDQPAPIASATTSTRIKLWSLYITLLNEVLNLDPDLGRQEFGKEYNLISSRVTSGEVWEQVVRDGYREREASVDAEVVYNLATLLLGLAPTQKATQTRLETYLSSASQIDLDLTGHLNRSLSEHANQHTNGANTPKDLNSRVKIIELFTLHVLPRNDEWDYARSFINNCDVLDEERRELFLQTLQELQDTKDTESYDGELFEDSREEPQMPKIPKIHTNGEAVISGTGKSQQPKKNQHQRTSSEVDYGIESSHPNGCLQPQTPSSTQPTAPQPSDPARSSIAKPQPPASSRPKHPAASSLSPPAQTPRNRPFRKAAASKQNNLISQVRHLFRTLHHLAGNLAGAITSNPTVLFRLFMFMLAFLIAFARPEVREKVRRMATTAWMKIRQTVGMGVKVSYI